MKGGLGSRLQELLKESEGTQSQSTSRKPEAKGQPMMNFKTTGWETEGQKTQWPRPGRGTWRRYGRYDVERTVEEYWGQLYANKSHNSHETDRFLKDLMTKVQPNNQ